MRPFASAVLFALCCAACAEPGPTAPAAARAELPPEVLARERPMTVAEIEGYLSGRKMSCRSENGNRMAVEMQAGGGLYLLSGQGRLKGNWTAAPGRIRFEVWNENTPVLGPYWAHVTAMPGGVEIGTDRCVFA